MRLLQTALTRLKKTHHSRSRKHYSKCFAYQHPVYKHLESRYLRANLKGLSLVEVLIVLAISAILISAGLPSFERWRSNTEAKAIAYELYSHLQKARALAVTRGEVVSICGADKEGNCLLRDFDQLQIFIDSNRNKNRDPNELLFVQSRLHFTGELYLNRHTRLQFANDGTSPTPASFIYCPKLAQSASVQRVVLSFAGRSAVYPDTFSESEIARLCPSYGSSA